MWGRGGRLGLVLDISQFLPFPSSRNVWRCASSICQCVAIRVCENCEPVAARYNRCGLAGVLAREGGGDILKLVHEIWCRFLSHGVIEQNSGLLHREVWRSFLQKRRVEARAVVTSAVFDLPWLPAISAATYGDAESATKLHLGRVGVDVLGKISGR